MMVYYQFPLDMIGQESSFFINSSTLFFKKILYSLDVKSPFIGIHRNFEGLIAKEGNGLPTY